MKNISAVSFYKHFQSIGDTPFLTHSKITNSVLCYFLVFADKRKKQCQQSRKKKSKKSIEIEKIEANKNIGSLCDVKLWIMLMFCVD